MKQVSSSSAVLALAILASPLVFADSSPPLEELDPEQRIEQLWAEQAEWIYETGYEGADTFASIQQAYRTQNGEQYAWLSRRELEVVASLTAHECVVRQAELVEYISDASGDGLDGLYLSYHDCVTTADDTTTREMAKENTRKLQNGLWYEELPLANMHPRLSQHRSGTERAVRGEALRAVMEHLLSEEAETIGGRPMHVMLQDAMLAESLCGIDPRATPEGALVSADVLRLGACAATGRPGGPGSIEALCEQLGGESETEDEQSEELESALEALGVDENASSWLSDFCDNMASGGALPGSSSGLDGFTEDECAHPRQQELAETAELAETMADCVGPAGGGGSSPADGLALTEAEGKMLLDLAKAIRALRSPGGAIGSGGVAFAKMVWDGIQTGGKNAKAREAGCYGGATCKNDENGDPVCVANCPVETEESDEPDSTTSSTSTGSTSTGSTSTGSSSTGSTSTGTTTGGSATTGATNDITGDGFDPNKESCQELVGIGVFTPDGKLSEGTLFDYLMSREPGDDPRKAYPQPDDMPDDAEGEECGEFGSAGRSPSGSKCNLPITCGVGEQVEDDCTCGGSTLGLSFGERNTCVNVTCPPDTQPTTNGGFDCMCSNETSTDNGDAPPLPEPPALGSVGVMDIVDRDATVDHMLDVMFGISEPGAQWGQFQ